MQKKVLAQIQTHTEKKWTETQVSALMCTTVTRFCRWDKESLRLEELAAMHSVRERFVLMLRMKWDKLAGVRTDVCSVQV